MKKRILSILLVTCALAFSMILVRAEEQPAYRLVTESTVISGNTVAVRVQIEQNPGIISLRFRVIYDDELELIQVVDQKLLEGMSEPSPHIASPYILKWSDFDALTDNTATGTVAILLFRAKDGIIDAVPSIRIEHIEGRNAQGEKVTFAGCETTIQVTCAHQYIAVVTAPTCTEQGYTTYTCSACGDSYVDSYVEATGHHHEMVDSKEPTATEDGYETWRCPDCGDEYTETIPATGEPALWGDVNGDGSVDYMDAYLIMRYAVGYITEDALDLSVADVNGDEAVDYMDAYLIMRLAVGYINKFPVE